MTTRPFKRIRYLERITAAGSLCMVFIAAVSSPVTTELFSSLGATELQFGLFSGIPLMMLAMIYVGAYWTNYMPKRKGWFMFLVIIGRLTYLPVALLPFLPIADGRTVVAAMIALIAIGSGTANLTIPMWFSWMGDLIPRRILNSYWGGRQRYLTLTLTLSALAVTALTLYGSHFPVRLMFAILVVIGCTAGVIDILLFRTIREPMNVTTQAHPVAVFMQPLRDRNYRSMVIFQCAFNGVSMMAAAFMLVYVLEEIALPLWQTSLLWCVPGLGMAMFSPQLGRLNDRYGHRPIIKICAALKPIVVLAFLFLTPSNAIVLLSIVLFFDSILNGGLQISANGFMLKMAPRENRSMFIAAMSALTGIAMGLGAILGGVFLEHTAGFHLTFAGRDWGHYHLLFALNLVLRLLCLPLANQIREPASARSRVVIAHIMGTWPMRAFTFPVGLYRRLRFAGDEDGEPPVG
ncbi:MAG: MFS transporter [Verrucomicrobia bacterium]|nr:MFS transporter [Verrucomicrobiota bacterium]